MELMPGELWFEMWGALVVGVVVGGVFGMKDGVSMLLIFIGQVVGCCSQCEEVSKRCERGQIKTAGS